MKKVSFTRSSAGVSACLTCLCAIISLLATGCPPPVHDNYSSAASIGDLITYSIDPGMVTYAYRVIESDFGLEGTAKNGILINNGNFTYSPLDDPTMDLVVFPGTLLVGHMSLPAHQGVFFAGVPAAAEPYSPEDIAGSYNWIGSYCDSALVDGDCPDQYHSRYGSMRINIGGTAEVCAQGDVDDQATHPCEPLDTVTWENKGNGLVAFTLSDMPYATIMIHNPAGTEKVMVMDLKNRPEGDYVGSNRGPGMSIGVNKNPIAAAPLDGMYFGVENLMTLGAGGYYLKSQIEPDDTYAIHILHPDYSDTVLSSYEGSLVRDLPWEGWVITDDSNTSGYENDRLVLILPESGVYLTVESTTSNFFYAGGRLNVTCTDTDGDGFYVEGICLERPDCNDSDANINPGKEEICNDGIDQNCDGYDCTGLIKDRNLELKIREEINKPEGEITPSDLLGITGLSAEFSSIVSLSGLEYCVNLTQLSLGYNQIANIGPLAGLVDLTWLHLTDNRIVDISPLIGLENLVGLNLNNNHIVDLSPLADLVNLTWLDLLSNHIDDLSPLAGLVNLTWLALPYNQIADLNPLADLVNLRDLHVNSNYVEDVSPLAGLVNLGTLGLSSNYIVDVSSLADLVDLQVLFLDSNNVVDLTPLAGLVNLNRLWLDLNEINDIYPLAQNPGIGYNDFVRLSGNPLSTASCTVYIPELETRDVSVWHDCP